MPKPPCFDFLSKPLKITDLRGHDPLAGKAANGLLHQVRQYVSRVQAQRAGQIN
jgi:hypothetical protein